MKLPLIVFGDNVFIFDSVSEAEKNFELWYIEDEVRDVYDAEGSLFEYSITPPPKKFTVWTQFPTVRLEEVSRDPIHKIRLRAELILYLTNDFRCSRVEESIFSLSLEELIETARPYLVVG